MRTRWLIAIILPIILLPALARAAGDPSSDPLGALAQLYAFIRTGHGTAAAGAAMVLFVWGIRSGLGSIWGFWKTPLGGYILGFGTAALLYFGTALESGVGFSLAIALNALGAGWVAAGGWEHLRDVLTAIRGGGKSSASTPPVAASGGPGIVTNMKRLALALAVLALSSCGGPIASSPTVKAGEVAAGGCVVRDVLKYAGDVESALAKETFSAALAEVAAKNSLTQDAIDCLVQTVFGVLTARQGSGPATGQEEPMVAHARAYLAARKSK